MVATEADAIAAGNASGASGERWAELYLPKLLANGASSMRRAHELIDDHGDLREWQVRFPFSFPRLRLVSPSLLILTMSCLAGWH